MTDTNATRAVDAEASLARWHLTLARLADNDNEPPGMRAGAMAAMLSLPLASTAAIAVFLRFLI